MHRTWRNGCGIAAVAAVVALGTSGVAKGSGVASAATSAPISLRQVWSRTLPDTGHPIAESSPTTATLSSAGPDVLVGDRSEQIYAFELNTTNPGGVLAPGWPASVGAPVDSSPSSLGSNVFVGVGDGFSVNSGTPGGYESLAANGTRRWFQTVSTLPSPSANAPIQSSLAVGVLQGVVSVVGGALGQLEDALNTGSGLPLPGWPYFTADDVFSSPAVADLYRNDANEIIEGGDSTAGVAEGVTYTNGGHVRVLSPSGTLLCEYNTNQTVESSPAVGQFLSGGAVGIAIGTGFEYSLSESNTNQVLGLTSGCGLAWASTLDGTTESSPALADALGNGQLQVAEGTDIGHQLNAGSVWLLDGATGRAFWHVPALGAVIGGISTVDLGGGHQDLVVGTTGGLEILDGQNGHVLAENTSMALQNVPLVTHDADGTVGITIAGYNGLNQGVVTHFEIPGSNGSLVGEAGSWSMFHHDAQLTGDAGTPPPIVAVPCKRPLSAPRGYWLAASDGGIFTFGNLPFCGSTGNIILNRPVVGMAAAGDAGGYWLVASDGGIFAFGDARFFGSTGNIILNRPAVGMAPTPDGKGYWLVASDGGIFTFGDARFFGSTGNVRLNQPVVGMAPTPDGKGYWLVASDGGIFAFGDARFFGSTGNVRLNQPVVGMAPTPDGGGYWLAASDGGIFAFGDARFYGSTGAVHLSQPVVGMAPAPHGAGYWLVASDGGVFAFGQAPFLGSTGGIHLTRPVVGMAGF
jgi:hypothetical protein